MEATRQNIAVIGAGISGIVTAHILSSKHQVSLFEKNERLGGHTNTVVIPKGPDKGIAVDTGFIVLNNKTYPNFHRFLEVLNVPVRWSCMSFAYHCEETGLSYAGTNVNGLLARRRNAISPAFWSMIWEIKRFSKDALFALAEGELAGVSLGEFLAKKRFSEFFIKNYLVPLSGAIWSCSDRGVLEFPAEMFVRFFKNHGLLTLKDRPKWQTVVGGSHSYLHAFEKGFSGTVRLGTSVEKISRSAEGVELKLVGGETQSFDKVVLAVHADEALSMLEDPSSSEKEALGAWTYSKNRTVLHTYHEILPPLRRGWASWNYTRRLDAGNQAPVSVSYHMNRLQGLKSKAEYCVTLNPDIRIPEERIIREIEYTHPVYTVAALNSQERLKQVSGERNTYYCGAYHGYGFHEDGVNSALEVAKHFGLSL